MTLADKTIASFEFPHNLRDMLVAESSAEDEHVSEPQLFNIRMANSEGRREKASLLIKKMYGWRGYSVESSQEKAPNKITLTADTEGATVGTMTLCFDSEVGLPADENFRDKLDELRAQGRKLCEPTRLAIEKDMPKRVFAAMIHVSYIYAHHIHNYTDYVLEVHPRHAMFYKRMLGAKDFGEERICTRVNAPAVLLRMDLEYVNEQVEKFGGLMEKHGGEKSFFPYFFPRWDVPGITDRLKTGRG